MSDISSHIDVDGPPIGIDKPSASRNERPRRPYAYSLSEPSTHFDPGPPPMQQGNGQIPGQVAGGSSHPAGDTNDFNPFSWPRLPRRFPPLGGWTPGNEPFAAVRAAFVGDRHVAFAKPAEAITEPVETQDSRAFDPLTIARLPRKPITDLPLRPVALPHRAPETKPDPFADANNSHYGRQYKEHRQASTSAVGLVSLEMDKTAKAQSVKISSHVGTENLQNLFNENIPSPPKSTSSSSYSGVFSRLSRAPSQPSSERVKNWTTASVHAGAPEVSAGSGVRVLPTHDSAGNMIRHVLVSPGAVVSTDGMIRPGDTMMLHCVPQLERGRVDSLRGHSPRRTYNPPPPGSQKKTLSNASLQSQVGGSQRGFETAGPENRHSVSDKDTKSSRSKTSVHSKAQVEESDPTANMPGTFQPDESSKKSGSNRSAQGSNQAKSSSSSYPAASKLGSGSNRSRGGEKVAESAGGFTEDKGDKGSRKGSEKGGFKADDSAAGGANAGTDWN